MGTQEFINWCDEMIINRPANEGLLQDSELQHSMITTRELTERILKDFCINQLNLSNDEICAVRLNIELQRCSIAITAQDSGKVLRTGMIKFDKVSTPLEVRFSNSKPQNVLVLRR